MQENLTIIKKVADDVEGVNVETLNDSQSQLLEFAKRIQNLDEQIAELKALRKDILKQVKSDGFNSVALNKAINEIRREKKETPDKKAEVELYHDLLENLIEPLES